MCEKSKEADFIKIFFTEMTILYYLVQSNCLGNSHSAGGDFSQQFVAVLELEHWNSLQFVVGHGRLNTF